MKKGLKNGRKNGVEEIKSVKDCLDIFCKIKNATQLDVFYSKDSSIN